MFSFGTLIALGASLGHLYLYLRLVRPAVQGRGARLALLLLLVALTAALAARRSLQLLPGPLAETLTTLAFGWMGLAILLITACVAADLARLAWNLGAIVQITDLHVGHFIGRRFVDELVARVNALRPDLVAITGDLVDGDVADLGHAVAALGNLRARFGRFFVTGNHDYSSGDVAWSDYLESLGISVLRNRRVPIGDAGGTFDLIGVDDWSGGRRRGRPGYDLEKAIAGRRPDHAGVLLAHQPANFENVGARGVDLQISGHTHGGQIFPATALAGLRFDYTRGLYREGDSSLYVCRGCGFWGPPMRVGSPPELARIILTS